VGVVNPLVLVGLGGVAGAVARHLVGSAIEGDNWDTLAANLLGSFALGALVAAPVGQEWALLTGTGFCGAFTTFSSFAFETVRLVETGRPQRALANAVGTLLSALLAVILGGALAAAIA
jgi:CrcB protein